MSDNKRVEVYIPRSSDREDPNLFVAINGVNYLLPKGKKSMVPQFVAQEIARSNKAADLFYEKIDEMKNSVNT